MKFFYSYKILVIVTLLFKLGWAYASVETKTFYNKLLQIETTDESRSFIKTIKDKAIEELELTQVNRLYVITNQNSKLLRIKSSSQEMSKLKIAFSAIKKRRNILISEHLQSFQYSLKKSPKLFLSKIEGILANYNQQKLSFKEILYFTVIPSSLICLFFLYRSRKKRQKKIIKSVAQDYEIINHSSISALAVFDGQKVVYKSNNINQILQCKKDRDSNKKLLSIKSNKKVFRVNKESSLLDIPIESNKRLFAITETQIIKTRSYEFYHLISYSSSDALTNSPANKIENSRKTSVIRPPRQTQKNEHQNEISLDEVLQETLIDLSLVFQLKNILIDMPDHNRESKSTPVSPNLYIPLKKGIEQVLYILSDILSKQRKSPMSEIKIEVVKVGSLITIAFILKDHQLQHDDINTKVRLANSESSLLDCLRRLQNYLVPNCGKYSFNTYQEQEQIQQGLPPRLGSQIQLSYLQKSRSISAPEVSS